MDWKSGNSSQREPGREHATGSLRHFILFFFLNPQMALVQRSDEKHWILSAKTACSLTYYSWDWRRLKAAGERLNFIQWQKHPENVSNYQERASNQQSHIQLWNWKWIPWHDTTSSSFCVLFLILRLVFSSFLSRTNFNKKFSARLSSRTSISKVKRLFLCPET